MSHCWSRRARVVCRPTRRVARPAARALHSEVELSSRRVQRFLVSSVAALVVMAMSVSADGAAGGHGKPTAKSIFDKGHAATPQASARSLDEGEGDSGGVDADEAESVRLRGEFQQSITAAPAVVAPVAGLVAARKAASSLPVAQGRWDEVTNKPFLNDPVDRGANFGVGWGNVTGRMTALTHSGSIVYAASPAVVCGARRNNGDLDRGRTRPASAVRGCDRDGPVGRLGLGRHR